PCPPFTVGVDSGMMVDMQTWTTTLLSKRIALLATLLLLATAHGCSCDDEQDIDGADVTVDASDSTDVGDADNDTGSTDAASDADATSDATDTDLDARHDVGEDADSSSDAAAEDADDADTAAEDADSGSTDVSDTSNSDTDDATEDASDVAADTSTDSATPAGNCISGASGTHAVRFSWRGNGPNSTAYVDYEINELPDTSRWKVGAYSQSFSYSPVYTDTFLGEGGLELSGTVFMDVELSTDGLGSVSKATIAVYGRSFNTTSPGSFDWQTFSGTGAAPSGLVSNSAPYQWYGADATDALPSGDDGILLRLRPGPPSNSLVVNSVEICFDTR
ncbi:MAG: hypothetical protein ACQEVA_16275, partial [Myxococcota bacterium]